MAKKKNHNHWKSGLASITGIAIWLLLSSIFDFMQGDFSTGRMITVSLALGVIIASLIVVGGHKLIIIIKHQMGL